MAQTTPRRNSNGIAPFFGHVYRADYARSGTLTDGPWRPIRITPPNAGLPPMNRLLAPILLVAATMALPALAQTPPAQTPPAQTPPTPGWPASRPPAQAAPPAGAATQAPRATPPAPGAPPAGQQASTAPPPIPLPSWFTEIDVNKKGEVTRADFLKYRMKSFDQLDANKDGKLTVDEFI